MARADNDLLAMALVGYEAQRAKIDGAIKEIQSQLGHRGPGRPRVVPDGAVAPAKRVLSVAARRKIAAAQRKRWVVLKKSQAQGKSAAATKSATPKKHKLSAAGRRGNKTTTARQNSPVTH